MADAIFRYNTQTTEQLPLKSILDELDYDFLPNQNKELDGGFKINDEILNEEKSDET